MCQGVPSTYAVAERENSSDVARDVAIFWGGSRCSARAIVALGRDDARFFRCAGWIFCLCTAAAPDGTGGVFCGSESRACARIGRATGAGGVSTATFAARTNHWRGE